MELGVSPLNCLAHHIGTIEHCTSFTGNGKKAKRMSLALALIGCALM